MGFSSPDGSGEVVLLDRSFAVSCEGSAFAELHFVLSLNEALILLNVRLNYERPFYPSKNIPFFSDLLLLGD